jgi:hypothetical protein
MAGVTGEARASAWSTDWRDAVQPILETRVRGELASWFKPPAGAAPPGAENWAFFANRLRFGASVTLPRVSFVLEGQDVRLENIPTDASLGPPFGALGTGPNYFLNTRRSSQGETVLKQAYATVRGRGLSVSGGRFEFSDGAEVVPADPTVRAVVHSQVRDRLLGPFDFTHVGRAFDGGRVAYDRPDWNATAMGSVPTQGAFEVSANTELERIAVAYGALTLKRLPWGPPIHGRLFYLYYHDGRIVAVKTDNRPVAAREADHDPIDIHTIGGDAVTAVELGPGIVDGLLWAAVQAGTWGLLDHQAWALALQAGYQLPRWPASPWLRTGYEQGSGDVDPDNDTHGTFFQVLPTPRKFARLPFFNMMNLQNVFGELLLKPHKTVSVRGGYHWLVLSEAADLWYSGGGAGKENIFGYAGIPSSDRRQLAQVTDFSVTWSPIRQVTVEAYYGHAFGQGVVAGTFAGTGTDYGFMEVTLRY